MQTDTIGINPNVLTDRELVRIADALLIEERLPESFIKELIDRLADRVVY